MTAGLLLCVLAVAFEGMAVTAIMPTVAADLGDLELYAWAFTALMIPQIVAIAVAGRWCDRLGPLRALSWGLVLFALGLAAAGMAGSMPWFLAGRAIQGLGSGGISLALMVVTGRAYDPVARARVMTWFSACWVLPSFVGPMVAVWLSNHLSWHWVFWSVLPIVAAGASLVIPGLLRRRLGGADDAGGEVSLPAAVAVALGAALLQVAGQEHSGWSVLWATVALALMARSLPRLMPARFRWGGGGLSATVVTRLLIGGSFFAMLSFLPLMLQQRGMAPTLVGLALALSSVGWMAGSWLQSHRWVPLSRDHLVLAGSVCLFGGTSLFTWGAWDPRPGLWLPVVGAAITGLGMGLAMASTSLVVMQLSEATDLGHNTSALQISEMLGNALIAGAAGTVFAVLPTSNGSVVTFGAIGALLMVTTALSVVSASRIGFVENHSSTASSG